MRSQIGILVNGWANRTPNVTVLPTHTPAAELSDIEDFIIEFTEQNHKPLDKTRRGSIQSQAAETKDDFNQFGAFRDSKFVCLL
jgi:hypothetical protein